ncbi:signal peptidase I [Candidatus Woesebacteria bacterium RIFCSPHIGHO2_01_FULL_41_10]|uniref:Signal peptidase I n=1 Tax=Candidatus Woesebacteria bacterium RIFCSPHIGHO2_01_FULL_41_10 TaxID=1802500 RepID=A0A1F7YP90_9BACT|nr:MAG: signal peptidase I [Candidatus Woesebacteria bacterium RIFCSPHIGHO2_01_FULL_41_10]
MKHYLSIFMVTLSGVCLGVAFSTYLLTMGAFNSSYRAYVVQSGSMEPTLKTGSVVITQTLPRYYIGDIVTFSPDGGEQLVTHRIVRMEGQNFITKGDANEDTDHWEVSPEEVVGKASFSIPFLGYLVDFTKTPKGFVVMVVIPASIIIYEELKTIYLEIKRSLSKLLRRSPSAAKRTGTGIAVIAPVIIVGLLFIAGTGSFFNDTDSREDNTIGVATTYEPTPSPNTNPPPEPVGSIVINEVYHSPDTAHRIDDDHFQSEWVELFNASDQAVNLNGWELDDTETAIVIGDVTLNPNEFLIISPTTLEKFLLVWVSMPATTPFYSLGGARVGNGLTANDNLVLLKNHLGEVVDTISWGTNTEGLNPAIISVAEGHSIERSPDGADTDTTADFIDQSTPTPGL